MEECRGGLRCNPDSHCWASQQWHPAPGAGLRLPEWAASWQFSLTTLQWRPTPRDTLRGQLLLSASETPDRPELAAEWDGRKLSGHADFERILEDLKKSYRRNQKNWKRLLAQVRD